MWDNDLFVRGFRVFHAPIHPVLRCFYVLLEGGDGIIWALFGGRLMLRLWRRERGGGKRGQGGWVFHQFW